jgi:hypothetical protein
MEDAKNRMYNYEVTPPEGVWNAIASELDKEGAKVIPIAKKRSNTFYYVAAASVAVILLAVIFFNRPSKESTKQFVTAPGKTHTDTAVNNNRTIITVPEEEKVVAKDHVSDDHEEVAQNKFQKGGPNPGDIHRLSKKKDTTVNDLAAGNSSRYITIAGPQGQPVKVSSKMAMLIDSSDERVPPKPIWNKKINEWREIMKGNTLAPTPGNFLDIIELTKTVKDHK